MFYELLRGPHPPQRLTLSVPQVGACLEGDVWPQDSGSQQDFPVSWEDVAPPLSPIPAS